jgi:type IV secretory pathway VirB10-like protein
MGKNPLGERELKFTYEKDLQNTFLKENFISLILLNNINSHLKGRVMGVVEIDGYAEHGDKIIIPKGTRAIGIYLPIQSFSQNRLIILWERMITPNGKYISLVKSQTADENGVMGVIGDLDKRYWERYGLNLTLSTLSNYANLKISLNELKENKTDDNNSLANQYITDFTEKTTTETSGVIQQLIKEQLMVKPIMHIEKGTRFLISPKFDIKGSK